MTARRSSPEFATGGGGGRQAPVNNETGCGLDIEFIAETIEHNIRDKYGLKEAGVAVGEDVTAVGFPIGSGAGRDDRLGGGRLSPSRQRTETALLQRR